MPKYSYQKALKRGFDLQNLTFSAKFSPDVTDR